MGIILDTSVLIRSERQGTAFSPWAAHAEARRIRRAAFVESVLAALPILDFDLQAACIHAAVKADLHRRGETLGANDLVIAAIALAHGHAVLTTDVDDFGRVRGLEVVHFPRDA